MTVEFNLPDIGEGLHEAEVLNWLVAVGDTVERNQPFVEIMTDKSTVEMPAPAGGTVTRLGVAAGEIVHVGELLVVIEDGSEPETVTPAVNQAAVNQTTVNQTAVTRTERRPKASPSTRRLATELGVDLGAVQGTGPGGRILADDVRAPRAQPRTQPGAHPVSPVVSGAARPDRHRPTDVPVTAQYAPGVHPLRGVRRATAKAMDLSWSTIPHICLLYTSPSPRDATLSRMPSSA